MNSSRKISYILILILAGVFVYRLLVVADTPPIDLVETVPGIQADMYLVSKLPILSMDQAPSSTDSAGWWTIPSLELEQYLSSQKALSYDLGENGSMVPNATSEADIKFVFTEKPTSEIISSVYKMIKITQKYLDISKIYIINKRAFLSRSGKPDIIISVPFNEGSLVPALQSIGYLSTIKKDAKVIDLSFKNPIIR